MLQSLHIRDLALIDDAEIRFDRGLNVISGETGGGKSLVVKALDLLCGGKATPGLVRHGADELRVDGEFALGDGARSRAVADLAMALGGAPAEDGVLLVTRTVDRSGRSKARIDGRPVPIAALRELGTWLVELHGQGEARALMRPDIQAETLDAFAGTAKLRAEFARGLADARALRDRLAAIHGDARARLQRIEFLRFQVQELDALALAPGETAKLESEHAVLANLDAVRADLQSALEALLDGEPSAGDLLARAARAVTDAASVDAHLANAAEVLGDLDGQVRDVCRTLQSRLGALDLDPSRLVEVEARLAAIRASAQRFGPTEADVLANFAAFRRERDALSADEQGGDALAHELSAATDALAQLGRKLVRARRKAAPAFDRAIAKELEDLGMPHVSFEVAMGDDTVDASTLLEFGTGTGPIPVEFLVRLNPGVPAKPLRETASGGEAARIVLAVKKCLADQDRVPFVAFDEIDAEIGGRLGLAVGKKLADVARDHQVLIVTHLPQVAAFAAAHWKVGKHVRAGTTTTRIERLDAAAAERELAAMAGGEGADKAAVDEARRLVARARAAANG